MLIRVAAWALSNQLDKGNSRLLLSLIAPNESELLSLL